MAMIEDWSIVLYGIRCDDLKVKKEYCDEENIEQDDVWNFLCSFRDLFGEYGLTFIHGGDDKGIYIGISPKYTWEDPSTKDPKTISEADKIITDFVFEYFDVEMSKEDFAKEINDIETCGWG